MQENEIIQLLKLAAEALQGYSQDDPTASEINEFLRQEQQKETLADHEHGTE